MGKEEKYTALDTEQCKWWVNTLFGMAKEQACNSHNFEDGEEMQAAQDKILKALEQQENKGTVLFPKGHTEFIENKKREIVIKTQALEQQPSDDCISRQAVIDMTGLSNWFESSDDYCSFVEDLCKLPPVTPTQSWIPLVWDEYPTVDIDGNDDYVYAVDYSVPMPKEDEWVLITDVNHNVVTVQYDGYDFGDYAREDILAWQPSPKPYEEKRGNENG